MSHCTALLLRFHLSMLLGVLTLTCVPSTRAQEASADLTHLSLEELMDMEVVPIDVLGSHIHLRGEWMVGYRFMQVHMDEHRADVTTSSYQVLPTQMLMSMHMLEVMYGVTDRLTLMVMLPFHRMSMEHVTKQGSSFATQSTGPGDLQVSAHYAFYKRDSDYAILDLGVGLPTGSINVRDDTPAGPDQRLPYPMQLGSGTIDLVTRFTYINQIDAWSWGSHIDGLFRTGRNAHQYRLGHRVEAGTWLARRITSWFAPMVHLRMLTQENVVGADPALNPTMTPTADPHQQQEFHIGVQPGLSFYVPHGALRGQRFALQSRWLLYETRDHHEHLKPAWLVYLTWRWTF